MQKLIYNKQKNYATLLQNSPQIETTFNDIVSVEQEGRCFVVKKIIGNDPRPNTILMVPISNTNLFIER